MNGSCNVEMLMTSGWEAGFMLIGQFFLAERPMWRTDPNYVIRAPSLTLFRLPYIANGEIDRLLVDLLPLNL
jgi:hypothetical protein